MNRELITPEVDWYCSLLAQEGLLTPESCEAVINVIQDNGLELSLDLVITVINENGLCGNAARLAEIKETAAQYAQQFGFPAESVFPPAPNPNITPEGIPEADYEVSEEALSGNGPSEYVFTKPELKGEIPDWCYGWPNLSLANRDISNEEARQLLNDFLHKARELDCSDIHLSAGSLPFVRRYKNVYLLPDQDVLSVKAAEKLNKAPLNEEQLKQFEEHHDLDYGYSIAEDDRYRTNLMQQRLGVAGSYRVIDNHIRSIQELGFRNPAVIEKLTTYGQGLILVTGPAGSGKSATLSALVDHINTTRSDHIITVEDPIELVHQPKNCNITQRELHQHTRSFGNALRAALREDPDVIIIGELRDLETIEMAIHSSETGHLVIGTLTTSSAPDTMNRLLDVFPYGQQAQIRSMVAESLKGVICQQLLPNAKGDGVVLITEIMLGTLAVSNLIRDGKTYQLDSTIQTSRNIGMTTMEQSHVDAFLAGDRSYDQTIPYIKTPELLRQVQTKAAQDNAAKNGAPKKKGWF